MKYNGIELEPITTPQIFDPPKKMLVWDADNKEPLIKEVCAIVPRRKSYPILTTTSYYQYCAEIPKPKRATNIQLMEWLAKGNGMWKRKNDSSLNTHATLHEDSLEEEVENSILIRPFGTTEWLEPTLENMNGKS